MNMVGNPNSLVWILQLLVWIFNNRAATTDFVTDASGDIRFDKPSAEVPGQTGPAKGGFSLYLRWRGGLFHWGGLSGFT